MSVHPITRSTRFPGRRRVPGFVGGPRFALVPRGMGAAR